MVVVSRILCCCPFRTWCLVIGWIQAVLAIISSAGLIFALVTLFATFELMNNLPPDAVQSVPDYKERLKSARNIILVICIFGLLRVLFQLFAGIMLITGVQQESEKKLKIWMICEIVIMALSAVSIVVSFSTNTYIKVEGREIGDENKSGGTSYIISIAIDSFCMWVVWVHRKEIIAAQAEEGQGWLPQWSQPQSQHQSQPPSQPRSQTHIIA